MKHLISSLLLAGAIGLIPASASAEDFIDFGEYDGNFLSLGARIGFNTSNMADDSDGKIYCADSWGTGFDAGVVADLHIRDWFSIQPGFFFQSRSHNYTYIYDPRIFNNVAGPDVLSQYGHTRHTMFKVPVLFSLRMHPASSLLWTVDLGPVFNFGIGGHTWYHDAENTGTPEYKSSYYGDDYNRFMMGLKMGTGLQVLEHYYIGVHYEAGLRSARKFGMGGRDKCWSFTIGYDF